MSNKFRLYNSLTGEQQTKLDDILFDEISATIPSERKSFNELYSDLYISLSKFDKFRLNNLLLNNLSDPTLVDYDGYVLDLIEIKFRVFSFVKGSGVIESEEQIILDIII